MTVFLPCRAGSERVPLKNTKDFAGIKGGLLRLKLESLSGVKEIDQIVVSTNDPEVIRIVKDLVLNKVSIDIRPDHLASSSTSTDDLINYVPQIIQDEHILWTHVTSPFLSSESLSKAIGIYRSDNGHDSVMSVTKIQTFLWTEDGALNYDRSVEKWPRTQTIKPIFEINSGFFISSRNNYLKLEDRIGHKPYLFETTGNEAVDIDWPEDFEMAEFIYKSRYVR